MKDGHLRQRHTRDCPRDADGRLEEHRCRGSWGYTIDSGRSFQGHRPADHEGRLPDTDRGQARTAGGPV